MITDTRTQLALAELRVARLRSHLCRFPLEQELPEGLSDELDQAKEQLRKLRDKTPESVGRYSGLTRAELAKTGTCETDWN
jgi:hypothetical protein